MESRGVVDKRSMDQVIDPRGIELFVVQIVFLSLVWVFFVFRLLVKLTIIKKCSLEDLFMYAAVLTYTAYATITIWGIHSASWDWESNPVQAESTALYSWLLCEVIYPPLSALIRTSIAVFLLRIATVKTHRYIIHFSIATTWMLSLVYLFLLLFQCTPISHYYEQVLGQPGSCIDKDVVPSMTIAHSIISALTDFLLALLPAVMLWDVKLNKRTKTWIATLLGMGLLAGIALIIRIPYVRFTPVSSSDFLNQTGDTALWSVVEMSLGIIAGCAATMRPLTRAWGCGSSRKGKPKSKAGNSAVTAGAGPPKARMSGIFDDEVGLDIELELARIYSARRGLRIKDTDQDSGSVNSQASIVHVQTSIEITREAQAESRSGTPSGAFTSPGGRTINISGPTSQGLSVYTK
ncbi:integral membrane protein [Lasiosphaeria hispida]|uniref:Integral membrane protein n=1 Tax=Lasiosphaeria hispida TaxID=260671 RepID=A0AAJ0HUA4_9PEZI|nr:integral membrane protein [Lasiosphaeria hispida]